MKKFLSILLALTLALTLALCLCACAAKQQPEQPLPAEAEPEPGPVGVQTPQQPDDGLSSVSEEDQLAQTGITLDIPKDAKSVSFYVRTNGDGCLTPQTNFTYQGAEWCFRAEPTLNTEPYNFSDFEDGWDDEGVWGDESHDAFACCRADGCGWIGWVDVVPGLGYILYSESCDIDSLFEVMSAVSDAEWLRTSGSGDDVYVDDGEYTTSVISGFDLFPYIWKYDDDGSFIRIRDDRTYLTADTEKNVNSPVLGCMMADVEEGEAETLQLLDAQGAAVQTLSVVRDDDFETTHSYALVDGDGRWLHMPAEPLSADYGALSGTYRCYIAESYLSGGILYVMECIDPMYPTAEIEALQVGGTLSVCDYWNTEYPVESLEPQADGSILLNDTMRLSPVDGSDFMVLTGHDLNWMCYAGSAAVSADTVFTDSTESDVHYPSLESCLQENGSVLARVTVQSGMVTGVEAYSIF